MQMKYKKLSVSTNKSKIVVDQYTVHSRLILKVTYSSSGLGWVGYHNDLLQHFDSLLHMHI